MASAPSACPARVERYDYRWSSTPAQRPSVGVLGHGVVIGRSRQPRPALRIPSARTPHPPSPHSLHLRLRLPSLPQRSQKQGMSKWWNACEHPGRCKPGIKGKSPNFYGYSILPIIEIKYDKLSKYYMTSNNRYLMLKRIRNRISFGCYYYLYDGNRRI